MDERRSMIIARGMAITLALIYIALFVACVWKYISTKDITNSTWELIFIVMIPVSILWFSRKDESLMIPRDFFGDTVSTGGSYAERKSRRKQYILDSFLLAVIILVLTVIDSMYIQHNWEHLLLFPALEHNLNIFVALVLELIISLIVFYVIAYMIGEWSVKRYHKKLDELEDNNE